MFNVVWIPIFLLMVQDLAGKSKVRQFPFLYAFLTAGLTALVAIGGVFILIDLLYFIGEGEWAFPFPIFLVLILAIGPLLLLTARASQKGEDQFTKGRITSGGRAMLYVIGVGFGTLLTTGGLTIIFYYGGDWIPFSVSITMVSIGIVILLYSLPCLIQERRKRL